MAYATVSHSDGFSVVEGQNTDFYLNFNDLSSAQFSWSVSFSGATADIDDFSGSSGGGSMGIYSYPPTTERESFSFSATPDELVEGDEFALMNVSLSGITFLDGSTQKSFEVRIQDNEPPTGDVTVQGDAVQGGELSADASGLSDPNGLGALSYEWLRDGAAISGAAGSTYTLTQADVGKEISVRTTYTDGVGKQEAVVSAPSSPVGNVNDAPTGDILIVGDAREGDALTVDISALADADGLGEVHYQWLRDGAPIEGATEESHVLEQQDVGSEISVEISYADGFGTEEAIVSDESSLILAAGEGTADNDTLYGSDGQDFLDGKSGDDYLSGYAGDDALLGREGNDSLFGGDGDDNIAASDGDDVVEGGAGADLIGGGLGNDVMSGGTGHDFMGGGLGHDQVSGGDGDDVVNGGAGNDTLSGGEGSDTQGGSFNDDIVDGDAGADSLGGGAGKDTVRGGEGDDSIGAGEGDDVVEGGAGHDFLAGGGRDDTISGGAGDDTINGGDGDDRMGGGDGADEFVFNGFNEGETDVILGFEDGIDTFRMKGVENVPGTGLSGYVDALQIADATVEGEAGASLTYEGHTILVQGVSAADLALEDFTFL